MGRIELFNLRIAPMGQSPRIVYAYLPNDYDSSKNTYDVLYMFDGHNLFSDETATYGKSWGIKDYLDKTGLPLVVIGVDCNHTGNNRLFEYCPYPLPAKHSWQPFTPLGAKTADWFVKVLKPECEKRYRIHSGREHVGIAGSSMGGLMSLYMISRYSHIYSKAACLSPTMSLNYTRLLKEAERSKMPSDTRIYIDYGNKETGSHQGLSRIVDHMLRLGHAFEQHGASVWPRLVMNGTHCEACWEKAVPLFLEYLYFPKNK